MPKNGGYDVFSRVFWLIPWPGPQRFALRTFFYRVFFVVSPGTAESLNL